jgi:hypothetical protein
MNASTVQITDGSRPLRAPDQVPLPGWQPTDADMNFVEWQ